MLSNGDARIGAYTNNTSEFFGWRDPDDAFASRSIVIADADVEAAKAAAGFPDIDLIDITILEFDITPTMSGPLGFAYVFGSEEYPTYSPRPGELFLGCQCFPVIE